MKLSNFFIERPIFAGVISAFITIAGLIALFKLPISEYPEVVPPSVVVHASYPGANPKVIADTVAAPLEQAIVGVEDMLYMSSTSTMDGSLTLTVTFRIGADIDRAQVQVQNRVAQALPRLPEEVRSLGVNTVKASSNLTLVVNLTSPSGRYDSLYLRNYAVLNIKDVLARLPGMGDVQVFGGGDYSMRVWLDPQKLAARNLTAGDAVAAIREQNVQVAAGQLGAPPSSSAEFQIALNAAGRLTDEQQFRDIIVKTGADGQVVRLGDIARIELGAQAYGVRSLLDVLNTIELAFIEWDDGEACACVAVDLETSSTELPTIACPVKGAERHKSESDGWRVQNVFEHDRGLVIAVGCLDGQPSHANGWEALLICRVEVDRWVEGAVGGKVGVIRGDMACRARVI